MIVGTNTHGLLRRIGRLVARINPLQRLANRTFCANLKRGVRSFTKQ
jgi:hypothetical protein